MPVKLDRQNIENNEAELWMESAELEFSVTDPVTILAANKKLSRYYRRKVDDLIGSSIGELFIDHKYQVVKRSSF